MKYSNAFLTWLPVTITITGLCILVYASVQQNYRQSLNDPQIQMAEDAAATISAGKAPSSVIPKGQSVDIAKSLSPWIAVYDAKGQPLGSTGILDDATPQPPQGIFDSAANSMGKDTVQPHENRLTWEPQGGLRQALVVVSVPGIDSNVYVVAGRNMREVEKREGDLSTMMELLWLVLIVSTLVVQLGVAYVQKL